MFILLIIKNVVFSISFFLFFFNSDDSFLETFQIDEIIYAELPTLETDLNGKLIQIIISVMLHGPYVKINPYSPYINNAQESSF